MTIEETKKCIEVMQAYANGEKIESRERIYNVFEEITNPIWDWDTIDYRVKPEPKVRPYANTEECFADVKKHGGWIKVSSDYMMITGVSQIGFRIYDKWHMFIDAAKICTWADDGSPCGVVEE